MTFWLDACRPVRLHDVPLVEMLKNPGEERAFLLKDVSDRLVAGVLLILSLPLVCVAAGLVNAPRRQTKCKPATSGWRHGKEFALYKLRTMVNEAESQTGRFWPARMIVG